MAFRRAFCWAAVAVLFGTGAVGARGGEAAALRWPTAEPADSLIRRLEPGPGFGVALQGVSPDALAKRWRVSTTRTREVVACDPVTGLAVRQRRRWLPGARFLVIDSTIANEGKVPIHLREVCPGDWAFRVAADADALRYKPLSYRNDVWYKSTYWTGPDWTRVGRNWHHPGIHTPSVRRFAVPRDGRVTITGAVSDAHPTGGDGVRVCIRRNARTVWRADIEAKDTKGIDPKLTLDVRQGDAIRFIVHKRGRIFCDTTWWDPVIIYADGQRFQASEGFSTKRQGDGGWFYEMETDPKAKAGLPAVRVFGNDLTLREQRVSVEAPCRLDARQALPLFVVADGADHSGVALAILSAGAWRFETALGKSGRLRVRVAHGDGEAAMTLQPGRSARLASVALAAYRGPWIAGASALQRLLASKQPELPTDVLRQQVAAAFRRLSTSKLTAARPPELDLWAMVLVDLSQQDKLQENAASYRAAAARHVQEAQRLIAELCRDHGGDFLAAEGEALDRLAELVKRPKQSLGDARRFYVRVRWLKRRIALANPLLRFGKLLFVKRVPTSYSHLVMQYFGWRARPGGGLFVLDHPGHSLAARQVFDAAEGNVLEPCLSYDASKIIFSYVRCPDGPLGHGPLLNDADKGFYHIWEVNADGTGLRQLTHGPYDDLMPAYLPDGGIVFCSTRRKGYARCFGGQFSRRWHVYTLHRMDADGANLRTLSFHDTNEWFPMVSNTGHILYARWDYIDRDAVTHQNLWATRPDGTSPVALWGNATPSPHCAFQARPVPGSTKILFTASAHHSITAGSLAIVDPSVGANGHHAVTRITPGIPFPEAEGRNIREYYAAPWPLSEKYYLVAYSPSPLVWEPRANARDALGIYLLDRFGNRELLYRDPRIGSTNAIPLVPRPAPPIPASQLPDQGKFPITRHASRVAPHPALGREESHSGEMLLLDVYQGLGDCPRGAIKRLRIVQVFPKTTHVANSPPVGLAGEENARAVLGTVPVEPDGSAYFAVAARAPILFQALDADGFAYQAMRSLTYLQPGERIACIGCHENRRTAPPNRNVAALRRPPSKIQPGPFGGRPFSFVEVVQPVLDRRCVKCHSGPKPKKGIVLTGQPHGPFSRSYVSLMAAKGLVPRFRARNQLQVTPPGGAHGARGSRLLRMLRRGHNEVRLSPDELRRLALWIDLNAIFYGAYSPAEQARLLRGERLAMPAIQ